MESCPKYPLWGSVTEGNDSSTATALVLQIMCSWTRLQWEVSLGSHSSGRALCFHLFLWHTTTQLKSGEQQDRAPCSVRDLLTQTLLSHCSPWWAAPHSSLFLLAEGSTCYCQLPSSLGPAVISPLQGSVCRTSELPSLLVSQFISCCPTSDFSICRFLRHVYVLSRDFFVEL